MLIIHPAINRSLYYLPQAQTHISVSDHPIGVSLSLIANILFQQQMTSRGNKGLHLNLIKVCQTFVQTGGAQYQEESKQGN